MMPPVCPQQPLYALVTVTELRRCHACCSLDDVSFCQDAIGTVVLYPVRLWQEPSLEDMLSTLVWDTVLGLWLVLIVLFVIHVVYVTTK